MHQSALFLHWAGCEQSYKSMKKMRRKERASSLLPPLRPAHAGGILPWWDPQTLRGLLRKLLEDPLGSGHCQPAPSNWPCMLGIHTNNLSFLVGSPSAYKYREVG